MESARRDRGLGLLFGVVGLGAAVALALLSTTSGLPRGVEVRALVILLMAAIFGIGRGGWLLFDARRRLRIADELRQPPPARIVRERHRPRS